MTAPPLLAVTRADLAAARAGCGSPVVFVPTMGALHAGHRSLLRRARELSMPNGSVVVSIFVNPRQFGAGEDFGRYPRTLDDDLAICRAEGAAIVFAPPQSEIYPGEQMVTVDPGPMGSVLEGEFRPGHFSGVLTVVLKLVELVRPDIAVFGEKDAQQLALVRQMTADLNLPVRIEPVPTARDDDGLAISSRNRYLSPAERSVALALPRALMAGRARAAEGPLAVLAAAREVLDRAGAVQGRAEGAPGAAATASPGGPAGAGGAAGAGGPQDSPGPVLAIDYLALVDPCTFTPVPPRYAGPAVLAVAGRAGATRLIDNVPVTVGGDGAGQRTSGATG
jgi:pantoate--beta-alanine ligase